MLETSAGSRQTNRPHSRNKHWVPNGAPRGGERWERGGHRGRGTHRNLTYRPNSANSHTNGTSSTKGQDSEMEEMEEDEEEGEDEGEQGEEQSEQSEQPEPDTPEEREKFWKKLVQERELERKRAIAEGKMDDPLVPKRLEDAITIVGTCPDMCPRFERYRRERENNLFQWETIPGTRRVDHKRAVKMYERAVGDKSIPSDIRPPPVLKTTLDYLFHTLIPENGFTRTYDFVRDRSRAVRNDFTLQHESGPLAMECHDRCARYHILALHYGRQMQGFSVNMEEQQLMQTLQSLKEFYEDQRGKYESPTELEMRVYHRLIHIRDQRERPDSVPEHITSHPVFRLTTDFRLHVQKKSEPIQKNSKLLIGAEGMQIFGRLVEVLRSEGKRVMIFLVACILERLFGVDTIEDMEGIRAGMRDQDIIDGISSEELEEGEEGEEIYEEGQEEDEQEEESEEQEEVETGEPVTNVPPTSAFGGVTQPTSVFGRSTPSAFQSHPQPATGSTQPTSAFSNLTATPSAFSGLAATPSPFGTKSAFGSGSAFGKPSPFGQPTTTPSNVFAQPASVPPAAPTPATTGFTFTTNPFNPPVSKPEAPKVPSALDPNAPTFAPKTQATPPVTLFPKPTAPLSAQARPPSPPKDAPVASTSQPPTSIFTQPAPEPDAQSLPVPTLITRSTSASSTHSLPKIVTDLKESSAAPASLTPLGRTPPPAPKALPISLPLSSAPTPQFPGYSALKREGTLEDILSPLFTPSVSRANSLKTFPFVFPSSPKKENRIPEKSSEPKIPSASPSPPKLPKSLSPPPQPQPLKEVKETKEDEEEAYAKAVQQSDNYSRKQKQRRKSNVSSRAEEMEEKPITVRKKRPRARLSSEYKPPVTDEDLVKRLQENREEHERRWATGTFLRAVRQHLEPRLQEADTKTSLWLSLNPENDGTAIWIERKFDVCNNSGTWYSEWAYSIPLHNMNEEKESPILIVFESTPLDGIDDDIERKFRVLEDCARLRQLVKTLPAKRWRMPTLLVFCWSSGAIQELGSDLSQMIVSLEKEGILNNHFVFGINSEAKNLDAQFAGVLKKLSFDTAGKLVCAVSAEGVFAQLRALIHDFSEHWQEKCIRYGEFDYAFYARLVQTYLEILEQANLLIVKLLDSKKLQLPSFEPDAVDDLESLYDAAMAWLPLAPLSAADEILTDLQTHRMMERDFPSATFLEQLLQAVSPPPGPSTHIMRADLNSALSQFKKYLESQGHALQQIYSILVRRSKRRRLSSVASESISTSSIVTSSSVSTKRPRLSGETSISPPLSREPTPQPMTNGIEDADKSMSSVVSDDSVMSKPFVTASMLRALAKEMRGKYGNS